MTTVQEYMDQGALLALREMLQYQLEERFGELSPEVSVRLDQGSLAELRRWVKRIVAARRIEDVFAQSG